MSDPTHSALRVVTLHAPADSEHAEELRKHLAPLLRAGRATLFRPQDIAPGSIVTEVTERAMASADVVLILVTADLVANDILDQQVGRCLHEKPAGRVIPILVRPTTLANTALAGLLPLPRNGNAISVARNRDAAWAEVAGELSTLIRAIPPPAADAPAISTPVTTTPAPAQEPAPPAPAPPTVVGATRVPLPNSLVRKARARQLIPFAGAGVSMAVLDATRIVDGKRARLFPSWKELLEHAADRLDGDGHDGDAMTVRGMLRKKQPDMLGAAKAAREGLGALWYDFLKEELNPAFGRAVPQSLALARSVWALGSPLVITTNYDHVLRWACPHPFDLLELRIEQAIEQLDLLREGPKSTTLWYLHGSIDQSDRLILTPDGYQRLYPSSRADQSYQAALHTLQTLLAMRSFLFVGFSFTDAAFTGVLDWVDEVFAGAGGPHYILVRKKEQPLLQERLAQLRRNRASEPHRRRPEAELPLELIPYEDHGAPLLQLLQELGALSSGGAG